MAYNPQQFQWALHVAKTGMSANEGLRQLVATGAGLRRAEWLAMVRAAKEAIEYNSQAVSRPGQRRPYRREMFALTTVTATGYLQHVDIWVQDEETGEIYSRPYSIRTDDLLTHDDAIATALDRYESFAELYGHKVLGATYSATYVLVPGGR